jgi:beta-lactamase superfamily II metal-dependent hydrolase
LAGKHPPPDLNPDSPQSKRRAQPHYIKAPAQQWEVDMHRVKLNSPAPSALKAVFPALFLLLAVFHFAPRLNAQAIAQLNEAAAGVEIPYLPAPGNASVYRMAPGFNIYFLSVGQGDSEYIELPNGQNVLIDGGPYSAGNSVLAQFLSEKNITKIDHVVLTHPHSDHYKGLQYVFSNIKVDNFYDTRMNNTGTSADEALRAQAKDLGVNLVYPAPGDSLSWGPGGIGAKVFNSCPEPVQSGSGNAINNCSITIKVSYQGTSALFVGDAEADVEAEMVSAYGQELKSDVLKVGHHGSKYSSSQAFLEAVSPARAYIEVGQNNYGHPAQASMNRIAALGTQIFRTDLDGTLKFSGDSSYASAVAAD